MVFFFDIDFLILFILFCLCLLNLKEENILGKKVFIIDDRLCIIDLIGRSGFISECYSLIVFSLFYIRYV